jgi:prepilin-type N-terminal cleavage/methylation domain-containing protein
MDSLMHKVSRLLLNEPAEMDIRSNKGFSLLETLIAIAVLAVISIAVLLGLSMSARANIMSDEQTTAGSIARSQIESIQRQSYDSVNNPPIYSLISNIPDGYSIVTPIAVRLDPKNDGLVNDDGIQQIAVTVMHGTKTILTLVDNKVHK